jgi:hypothetical protein
MMLLSVSVITALCFGIDIAEAEREGDRASMQAASPSNKGRFI